MLAISPSNQRGFRASRQVSGLTSVHLKEAAVMWLNVIIMGVASLAVGFVLGWVAARPRRWDFVWDTTLKTVAEAEEPLPALTNLSIN